MVRALHRFTLKPPTTAWATYVRCHDDIGWAVDDGDAASIGWDGWSHRRFLSDWFSGAYPGSSARGLVFQGNPATGDRRISGTAASLARLEAALTDEARGPEDIDNAVRRILLLHVASLGFGGVPLIWMGDELALCNDQQWATEAGHAEDNRWAHRPKMPWDLVDGGLRTGGPADAVFTGLRHAVEVRARQPALHAATETQLMEPHDPALLAWLRPHAVEPLVALHNLSGEVRTWPTGRLPIAGPLRDALTEEPVAADEVVAPPYGVRWLVRAPSQH